MATLGATYDEFLKPSASVLISNTQTPNASKVRFAVEHGIPVVTPDWLWRCIETTKRVPFSSFLIQSYSSKEVQPVVGAPDRNGAGLNDSERRKPSPAGETTR